MNHYVYKIVFSHTEGDKYYIGVRSCKCAPEDDISYWSSSKVVKDLINEHGIAAFKKVILDKFDTRSMANSEEIRLHALHKVDISDEFLNISRSKSNGFATGGRKNSQKERDQKREKMLKSNPFKGKTHSARTKAVMSEKAKLRDPWNKGLNTGQQVWNKGLTKESSEVVRTRMSENKIGKNNPMFGKSGKLHPNSLTIELYNTQDDMVGVFYSRKELLNYCKNCDIVFSPLYNNGFLDGSQYGVYNGWYLLWIV